MDITVEMNADEYDLFREFQRGVKAAAREAEVIYGLRRKYDELCAAVFEGFEVRDFTRPDGANASSAEVLDNDAAVKAVGLASEWLWEES